MSLEMDPLRGVALIVLCGLLMAASEACERSNHSGKSQWLTSMLMALIIVVGAVR